ncbi:MAG: hypothetical protein C0603_10570 [Denitrovibrio sp.]|nr:MAG: hypothetical protein C0603_10570 [Denitrovibrio sp.]
MEIYVFVYLPGETIAVPAGLFNYNTDDKTGHFLYGRKYEQRPNAVPVDPVSLPLHKEALPTTINEGLYGVLRDSIPDYWGRMVFAAKRDIYPEQVSNIDLMLDSNGARIGNLDFRSSPDDPEPQLDLPHFSTLANIINAAVKIENNEKVSKEILDLYAQGSSMGGARPKCSVEHDEAMWLVKFPSKNDKANMPAIEYASMKLAKLCGIKSAEVLLQKVGTKDVLMVRRFDRQKRGNNWLRNGFMSALSFMQWDERDRDLWSYYSLAEQMRTYMSVEELKELYRRMVFNILINNTDDHPRNHGFLFDRDSYSLSPAYDILPEIKTAGVSTTSRLAMALGEAGREATIENALSSCRLFGWKSREQAMEECVRPMQQIFKDWSEFFESCGVSGEDIKMLESTIYKT